MITIGQPVRVPTDRAGARQVRGLEPEVVIAQAAVAVRGRPIATGWEGLGPRFARYLAAVTLSWYGDWFTTVALVVVLFHLSGPAAPAGYMVARVLPRLLSGTAGGSLADRFRPQHVVATCASVQGLATAAVIPAARIHAIWAVYGAVVLAQFAGGLAKPALGALVPRIASARRLQRANSLCGFSQASSVAIAPALAAPLLVVAGPELLLVIDALTFAVAALLVGTLRVSSTGLEWGAAKHGVTAGLHHVWNDPGLRAIAAAWLASAIAVTTASSVLVLIARTFGDASLVGYLYAAVGGGAVVAGPLLLRLRPERVTRDVIIGVAIAEVLCLALVTLHGPIWAALVPLGVSGASGMVWQTWGATDMQTRSHPGVLGRVNAVAVTAASLGMLLGAVLALGLVPILGWQRTLFISCCLALAVLAAGVVAGPQRTLAPAPD
jgi:MFS family permease